MVAEDIYGIMCELPANSVQNCSIKSPVNVPNTTLSMPLCMIVEYDLSSDDVLLTADIWDSDDNNLLSHETFAADRTTKNIRLTDAEFAVSFVAKRLMTSAHQTEQASVNSVKVVECASSGE